MPNSSSRKMSPFQEARAKRDKDEWVWYASHLAYRNQRTGEWRETI